MDECIFCKIVKGDLPSYKIWEDDEFLAILSIFPNTEGFTVVLSKKHFPSYAFDLPDNILSKLILASKKVAKLLDTKLDDVGRTGLIFEGFGVDHIHSKLFPMHGTKNDQWKQRRSNVNKYFKSYEGYISSHDYLRENDQKLAKLAQKLLSNENNADLSI